MPAALALRLPPAIGRTRAARSGSLSGPPSWIRLSFALAADTCARMAMTVASRARCQSSRSTLPIVPSSGPGQHRTLTPRGAGRGARTSAPAPAAVSTSPSGCPRSTFLFCWSDDAG